MEDQMPTAASSAVGSYRADFLAAIDTCLKVRIADRPQSVGDVRQLLAGHSPARLVPETPVDPETGKWFSARINRLTFPIAAAVVFFGGIYFGIGLLRQSAENRQTIDRTINNASREPSDKRDDRVGAGERDIRDRAEPRWNTSEQPFFAEYFKDMPPPHAGTIPQTGPSRRLRTAAFPKNRGGWLGIKMQNVVEQVADSFDTTPYAGALVVDVTPNGPAERAGVQVGDIITRFNSKEIKEIRSFLPIIRGTVAGKHVDIAILRAGRPMTMQAIMGRSPGLPENAGR
jgi:membrane-associated protease RseP (regulator of RpoE activity)